VVHWYRNAHHDDHLYSNACLSPPALPPASARPLAPPMMIATPPHRRSVSFLFLFLLLSFFPLKYATSCNSCKFSSFFYFIFYFYFCKSISLFNRKKLVGFLPLLQKKYIYDCNFFTTILIRIVMIYSGALE
jgi:hypothetical protein